MLYNKYNNGMQILSVAVALKNCIYFISQKLVNARFLFFVVASRLLPFLFLQDAYTSVIVLVQVAVTIFCGKIY